MRFASNSLWLLLLLLFSIFFLQSYAKAVGAGGRLGGGGKFGGWKWGGRSGSIGRRSSRFKWNDSGRKSSYRLTASRRYNYRPAAPSRRPILIQPHNQFFNPLHNVPLLPYLPAGQPALRASLGNTASYQPHSSSMHIEQLSSIRSPDLMGSLTPWRMCQLCLSGDRTMEADEFDSHLSMCHMCTITKCCLAPVPDTFSFKSSAMQVLPPKDPAPDIFSFKSSAILPPKAPAPDTFSFKSITLQVLPPKSDFNAR